MEQPALEEAETHWPVPAPFAQHEGSEGAFFFFWLVAAWVKSRAERPSVSEVN